MNNKKYNAPVALGTHPQILSEQFIRIANEVHSGVQMILTAGHPEKAMELKQVELMMRQWSDAVLREG